jgi:peptidoglycan/LPS O-acetylase OafA/YrhL
MRSLMVAFAIVAVATISLWFFEDPLAQRQWPAVAAPVIPAVFVLASFFTGGFHGVSLSRFEQAVAVFGIALLMWWPVAEGCRRVLRFARGPEHP